MLVKEIIALKQQQALKPDYALQSEVIDQVKTALKDLVQEGTLSRRIAGVNRAPAFSLPTQNIK